MFVNRAAHCVFILLLSSSHNFAADPKSFANVACEGDYQHHLQGVCTDKKDAVYWSFNAILAQWTVQGAGGITLGRMAWSADLHRARE